ncbi:Flp family type IVb pilin [Billgrantia diversa]|uniref:Flp family type IVb pilin n=1 Tax=Halomonas sp. MCCC 1A13316 TaxID=2733487 RepID=UPI0018D4BDF1|nr:hypothetical protein [Halomonas sp. MCCC 1A13316]
MNKLMQGIERFWKDEEGAEVVEWVLVCALIVAAFVAGYTLLSAEITAAFKTITDALSGAGTTPAA